MYAQSITELNETISLLLLKVAQPVKDQATLIEVYSSAQALSLLYQSLAAAIAVEKVMPSLWAADERARVLANMERMRKINL